VSTSVALLEQIAPQFEGDARAEVYLELAASVHTASVWGSAFSYAMALYAAHLLTQADRAAAGLAGTSGPVTSKTAGDLSESYGNSAAGQVAADAELAETSYGRQYIQIRKSRSVTAPTAIGVDS
jgi:hypothetical protein